MNEQPANSPIACQPESLSRRRKAVVEKQELGACGAQQRRRILLGVRSRAVSKTARLLPRLATELQPPARTMARRYEDRGSPRAATGARPCSPRRAPELVERLRMSGEDSVRVLVDEADPGSVLQKVTLMLEFLVLPLNRPPIPSAGPRGTGVRERLAERAAENRRRTRARPAPPRCVRGRRTIPRSSRSRSLSAGSRVDVDRLGSSRPRSIPSRPADDDPAEGQIGVAGRVRGLELHIGRRLLIPRKTDGTRSGASRLS